MADDNQPTTQLNKEWLQKFKDNDIAGFRKKLTEIAADGTGDPVVPSMKSLKGDDGTIEGLPFGTAVPLAIGNLAAEGNGTHGDKVNKAVVEMVNTLDGIITSHTELFRDIDSALEETIDSLVKTQGKSLDAIDGQKLYEIFEDEGVEADLTTKPGEDGESGGGSSKDDDDD